MIFRDIYNYTLRIYDICLDRVVLIRSSAQPKQQKRHQHSTKVILWGLSFLLVAKGPHLHSFTARPRTHSNANLFWQSLMYINHLCEWSQESVAGISILRDGRAFWMDCQVACAGAKVRGAGMWTARWVCRRRDTWRQPKSADLSDHGMFWCSGCADAQLVAMCQAVCLGRMFKFLRLLESASRVARKGRSREGAELGVERMEHVPSNWFG